MKLRLTIPATDLVKNIPPDKRPPRVLRGLLGFLEKYFGSPVLLEIPLGLQGFSPDLLPLLNVASQFKSLGIIEELAPKAKLPDEPYAYQFYTKSIGHAHGAGIDFLSQEKAAWKSLAEAVERFLWYNSDDFYAKKITNTTSDKLKGKILNTSSLVGFSKEQRSQFSILSYEKSTPLGWIKTQSLTSAENVWCPAQLFSNYYARQNLKTPKNPDRIEPMLRWAITTGLATGRCLEEATVKGILEVIERDAFMISYLNQLSPPVFNLDYLSSQDADIAKVIQKFRRYNLEVSLVQLPSDFPVFVVAAIIVDRTGVGPAFSIGASADFDLKTSILDALSESLIVRIDLKNKYKYGQEVSTVNMNREGRMLYWANPKNLSKIEFLTSGPKINVDLEKNFFQWQEPDDHKKYYTEKLTILTDKLKELNYKGYVAELTTKPIKKLGLRSVQVVIPKLQPMHLDESIPYFSGSRLKEIPKQLGYISKEPVNQEPHPFP